MTAFARSLRSTVASLHLDRLRTIRERIEPSWITAALEGHMKLTIRRRKLPPDIVIWLVIGISLFGDKSFPDVLRSFALTPPSRRGKPQSDPTSGAIAQARQRLGSSPMRELVRVSAKHWLDQQELEHLRYRGLRVLAADGVSMRTPDTRSNDEAFGKPDSRKDGAAFPQIRAVCLLDVATHLVLDASIGKYTSGEHELFLNVLGSIPPKSLTILDRNFISWALLYKLHLPEKDRHFLVRSKRTITYKDVKKLGDDDNLVEIFTRPQLRKENPDLPRSFQLRRLTCTINGKQYILLTSLLDPTAFPASELIQLYRQRWEIELAYDDMKTEQRAAALTLRSKLPEGVRQEFYGMTWHTTLSARRWLTPPSSLRSSPPGSASTAPYISCGNSCCLWGGPPPPRSSAPRCWSSASCSATCFCRNAGRTVAFLDLSASSWRSTREK